MSKPLKSYSIEELSNLFKEAGLPSFRVNQILEWVYAKGVNTYGDMTNIPKTMREQLGFAYPLTMAAIDESLVSGDGSRKYLLRFHDGVVVETVGLPSEDGRLTVCCSSQAGCAMGCTFCATGRNGLVRDLAPGEIVDQLLVVQEDFGARVTNVVIMGQGEPFANYDNLLAALRIMNHPKLLNIGARHITVSTCGLISGIEKLAGEPEQFTLAVSLHAARQEVRDTIMPAMQNQRLGALRQSLEHYSSATGRRYSFEYALMKGVNDAEEDLDALITYCRRLLCHVNLIPLNEVEGMPMQPSGQEITHMWFDVLEEEGIPVSVRRSRGADISGACGQLANARRG